MRATSSVASPGIPWEKCESIYLFWFSAVSILYPYVCVCIYMLHSLPQINISFNLGISPDVTANVFSIVGKRILSMEVNLFDDFRFVEDRDIYVKECYLRIMKVFFNLIRDY